MPRGEHPNSRANLRPSSSNVARENGKKGGLKKAQNQAVLKSFRQIDLENTTLNERQAMLDRLKQMAMIGNIKALELYLKIIGEYETKLTVVEVEQSVIDEVEAMLNEQS